jgi:chaperonin GroEL
VVRAAKDLHFNKNMEALKKMQAGADKLATVVGVTLGPKVRKSKHAGHHPALSNRKLV